MKIFITGTDTDVGKTFVTASLALAFKSMGKKVGVFKPLQSGAIETSNGLLAPDLEEVKKFDPDIKVKYSYLLKGEVSPALAAKEAEIKIDLEKIKQDFEEFSEGLDIVLVEGAGGLYCPAGEKILMADVVRALHLPAIIVARPDLGTVNHTLMTAECAKINGIAILGVIINKYPTDTKDPAILNVVSQIEDYTDVKVISVIGEVEDKSGKNLSEIFKNGIDRMVS